MKKSAKQFILETTTHNGINIINEDRIHETIELVGRGKTGVLFDPSLTFSNHVVTLANKTNLRSGLIKLYFKYLNNC